MADVIPQEALNYLSSKKLKPGFDYRDVWRQEHNNAFTVAKMMQLDILQDTKDALVKALEEGQTFKQFQESLKPTLVKKGWWGIQTMDDPLTKETKQVQLGSEARLNTIYKTNMRTARAAGQWERVERTKETHPYLLYQLGPSREHREDHVKWNGLLLPVEHEFWQTHYPTNGWGCKCRVRQVSEREADKLKAKGAKTEAPEIKTRQLVNKRTGEVESVPEGIDPGWNYNPGITKSEKLSQYSSKLNGADAQTAKASIHSSLQSLEFEQWYDKPQGSFPMAILSKADMDKIGSKVQTAVLSADTSMKQHRVHGELKPIEYASIQDVIDNGEQIPDGAKSIIYLREQPKGYVVIVKATRSGEGLFITSFRRLSQVEAKRDKEVQRLRGKK